MAISIASRPVSRPASTGLEACLLAKCLFCCNFHSIASNFHSPKAWFEACLGTDCLHVSMSVRMYVCNHVCMSVCMTVCVDVCMSVCNLDAIPSRQLRPKILGCHPKAIPTDTLSAQPWDGTPTVVLHSCTHSCSHSSPVVLHFFLHSGQSYKYGHARPATNSHAWGCIFVSLPGLDKKCIYCCYVLTAMWIAHLALACSLQGYCGVIHDNLAGSD